MRLTSEPMRSGPLQYDVYRRAFRSIWSSERHPYGCPWDVRNAGGPPPRQEHGPFCLRVELR